MSTGALGPNLEPGQWKIVDSAAKTVGRMSHDGKTLEIFKVGTTGSSKSSHLSKVVEKLNSNTQKYLKVSDTLPLAIQVESETYTVQYKEKQELVNTVAQRVINPLSEYSSKPVPKPPKTTWTENDSADFVKKYDLMNTRTKQIATTPAEVTKIMRVRFEKKETREDVQKALTELEKTGSAAFIGYTVQRKKQEAPLSTQERKIEGPPVPRKRALPVPPNTNSGPVAPQVGGPPPIPPRPTPRKDENK